MEEDYETEAEGEGTIVYLAFFKSILTQRAYSVLLRVYY